MSEESDSGRASDAGDATTGLEVAIVGLAGRFPGAADTEALWANLCAGVESIRPLAEEELVAAGLVPEQTADPRRVRAAADLEGIDLLDAPFFDLSPREAESIDPQHRLFLECAWTALEDAGLDPARSAGPIGVFVGVSASIYALRHVLPRGGAGDLFGGLLGADKDHLATLTSYKLDLEGPSVAVQSACSSALVAVHFAAQSLLNGECDAALAGGSSILLPQTGGYLWQEGGIVSPDGHCRAFDARAEGTVFGNGVGVVLLKRLADALAARDRIHAVIKGSAVNNDGRARASYTAPRAAGQAKVIRAAQLLAEVDPKTIRFVEAHGTGTPLGDPIEVSALVEAFGAGLPPGSCALGSIKPNIGHLNAASGVAGLIKAALALERGEIPKTLHFERENPALGLAASPFYVNTETIPWPAGAGPRRAAVSSFGMGGTNAHAILEQAPPPPVSGPARPLQLLLLSARTESALDAATDRLATSLSSSSEALADIAFTLALGRHRFRHRRAVVAGSNQEAIERLTSRDPEHGATGQAAERRIYFLFPGQGAPVGRLGRGLYETEPVFRAEIDRCCALLAPHLGVDLVHLLFSAPEEESATAFLRTEVAQPALFAFEWSFAKLWRSWGVRPDGLLGHSLGELVAATVAGVFELPDALALVALRGRLMQAMPPGAMLAVPLSEQRTTARMPADLALAAVNAPDLCVVSGPEVSIERFERKIEPELPAGQASRRLRTAHAFHSSAMDPALSEYAAAVEGVARKAPRLPFVSNLTGTWITAEQATDPDYWASHLRRTVRFADGLSTLAGEGEATFLEVGPGRSLSTLVRRHPATAAFPALAPLGTIGGEGAAERESALSLSALGRLWVSGAEVDEGALYRSEQRRRVTLPTYPFERRRYWIEAVPLPLMGFALPVAARETPEVAGSASDSSSAGHARPRLGVAYVAPESITERVVAAVWSELFGFVEVGVHDDFFDLGGSSLVATGLAARLRTTLGVEVPLDALFEAPTVARLAAWIDARVGARPTEAAPAAEPAAGGTVPPADSAPQSGAPLSFSQERLWLLDRLVPDNAFYTLGSAQRLGQAVDVPALAAALAEVVQRHETLRASFGDHAGRPRMTIHPSVPVQLPQIDLAALPAERREPEATRVSRIELHRPFDLGRAPLMRCVLLRLAPVDYALIYSFHHIVSDGTSLGLFGRELFAIYPAFAARRPSPLPPLPIQFSAVAARQREQFAHDGIDRQLAYWRKKLAGAPITELPADRPRTPLPSHRGATLRTVIGGEVFGPLMAFARSRSGSTFMALLGGFYSLVSRHVCQTDLVVGVPIAGRAHRDEEGLIGFFVNNLVLRADLSGDPSFGEIFARVRELALDAYSHQEVPFERLVEELAPRRDMSRNPLFQLMFNLMPKGQHHAEAEKLGGLLLMRSGTAPFDLQVYLFETSDRLTIGWEFATDLFEAATIERFAGHYRNVLAGAAENPEARLSELPLLGAAERAELLLVGRGAATPRAGATSWTVPERFAAQARRTPSATAVVTAAETLDYATLHGRVNGLARRLTALGIGAEAKVGIMVERGAALPVATLGVLTVGASYVPLDPGYPAERLAYMAADAGLAAVIVDGTSAGVARAATGATVQTVEISTGGEVAGGIGGDAEEVGSFAPLPESLAYTIYTSGSTGKPKGVELSHGALASFLAAMIERPGVGPEDVFVAVTSLSFDIAGLELFAPLLVGARTVIARRDEVADGRLLADLLAASGATILQATSSGWRVLLAAGWTGTLGLKALVGGEALPAALSAELLPRVASLWNMYGPTETAVWSTLDPVGPGAIAIGRPVPATRLYVVDSAGQPMPRGLPGEMWIGGAGVARGYHARPDLTAERFVPDAFSAAAGARLYRTGDLGRFLPDGRLECLGRTDHQVKVRGHRIELGEIESALAEAPGVLAAAAIVFGDGEDRRIAAYVVERPGAKLGEGAALRAALGAHLSGRLPEAYMPSTYTRLDRLPLTPNGKVDRKALPSPDLAGAVADGLEPPRTPTEKRLAGFWRELLGVAAVGVESNFFQLGGHSLLAMRLLARIREELGVELLLRRVFEAPTLGGLAAVIDGGGKDDPGGNPGEKDRKDAKDLKSAGEGEAVEPPPVPKAQAVSAPLSFAQQRLWLIDRLNPGNPFYNLGGAVRLSGPLDRGALHAALREIGRRHDTLRTRFAEVGGEPVQIVEPELALGSAEIDLSGLGQGRGEPELLRLSRAQFALPFDLEVAPLLRSWLLRFGAREHALVYSMHHIVSDGWSMGLLFGEVAQVYGALLLGRPPGLPPLPLQYADFAVQQRAWFAAGELARQLGYWREQLAGLPSSELPTDRPRPAVASHRGRTLSTAIAPDLVVRLEQLGRAHSASTFMVLLAGFQGLVARYVGEGDSVLGMPVANRTRSDVEGLIGFFVNTLVLRTSVAGDPTFAEAIERAKTTAFGAFGHQDLPFERLVEELAPRRDLGRNPLFQLIFNLVNVPFDGGVAGDLAMTQLPVSAETALVDLQLYLRLSPARLGLHWEYATDLFEASTIERLARHYETLLTGAAERPETRLFDLPLLGAAERAELLAAGTGAAALEPRGEVAGTVPALFAAQALRTPSSVAVVDASGTLDYATLLARVNVLARRLIALGVCREAKVGIAVERTAALPVAALGVLAAGASYVPLDPGYPAERLAYMAVDAGLAALIVDAEPVGDEAGLAALSSLAPFTVALGAGGMLGEPAAQESGGELAPRALPGALAYTIYTSGSTGRPKGVELSHGALVSFLAAMIQRPGIGASDVFVASTSLSFDIAGLELYAPLLVGARTVIARRDEVADGRLLADLLRASGATILQATPSGWRVLLASAWPGDAKLKALVGGEALPPALAAELGPKVGALWNMYGPTETAVWSTLDEVDPAGKPPITIGRPIPATEVHVADVHGNALPWGVPGELWIGGAGVARGYHGRPDLTAERFLPDPFSGVAGARLYATGDLARFLPDGRLEVQGRIDHQVKIRGHRIELLEIERVLADHQGVGQAAARVFGEGEDKRIAAYVVERPGTGLSGGTALRETLLAFLRGRLPEAMIPSSFSRLDRLPLTPNGKVDRKALPAPDAAGSATADAPLTPLHTPTEQRLAGIWRELLGVEQLGVESHFFDLGGHSLLAMRLISRIREDLGVELPLRRVFEAPQLGRLAAAIEPEGTERILAGSGADLVQTPPLRLPASDSVADRVAPAAPPLVPLGRQGDFPLSFAQERLWFLDRLAPGSPAYNVATAVRLVGSLWPSALSRALGEVIRRHETLRTTFGIAAGRPVQRVALPGQGTAIPAVDLSGLVGVSAEFPALVRREAVQPFDLERGPLVRATLVRLDAADHALLLTVHHVVSDAWSMGVLIAELVALYVAYARGRTSPLPELPVQYADFALWQRGWLSGAALAEQMEYWRRTLKSAPTLALPADRPRRGFPSDRGGRLMSAISPDLVERLRTFARDHEATLFMVLLAAFEALLARLSGERDLVVGTTIANRARTELEPLIGFFINTLALRADLSADPSFSSWLATARSAALGAYAHQDLPFEQLVAEIAPERDLARSPLFSVLFQLQPAAAATAGDPGLGLEVRPVEMEGQTAKFDLVVSVADGGVRDALGLEWKFRADLFDRSTVERWAGHWRHMLEGAVAAPETRISELPLLSATERDELVARWGRPESTFAPFALPQRFAEQAASRPDAIAVSMGGAVLTYGDLARRATVLARRLLAAGVAPGDLVGLCVERSIEMVVGILGILQAGAAYVPLDPHYPQERLAYLLADSGVRVLVTERRSLSGPPESGARVLLLEGAPEPSAWTRRLPAVAPELPAYVIYTSGSTGKPKGVVVTHANVARLFAATENELDFDPADVWTLFHSYAFDFSVWEIWGALLFGGRLEVVPYWLSRSPGELLRLLVDERVTVLSQTPSAFRQLQAIEAEEAAPVDHALSVVVFGGEALDLSSLRPWIARHGEDRPLLVNMYGITETTVHVTYRPLGAADAAGGSVVGPAIPDLSAQVVDLWNRVEPAPVGVPGEILVGGAGLALGYLRRPELTAERFVPDPASETPGARRYRSGDLGRRLPDGDLEYLGRIDTQVKVRGFRIELGEIEAAVLARPGVRECVVVAVLGQGGQAGDPRLVAYAVGDAVPTLAELRADLATRLPDYMLPSALVRLDALPLSAHGKVDRRALPAPERPGSGRSRLERERVAPATPLEVWLAGAWAEVLGVEADTIGVDDDFFEQGGNSIRGAVLINRLQQDLGELVQVVVIFDHPTIAALAAYVEAEHPEGKKRALASRGGYETRGTDGETTSMRRIDEAALATLAALVRPLGPPNAGAEEEKNPPALFVLSPPRSGTTLLRVMLAGHPLLFAPPELELLTYRTMGERRAAFSGRDSFWLEGVLRAVMEIRGTGVEAARDFVAECEARDLPTAQFFGLLQEELDGRMLVDKTPSYALDPEVLRRGEAEFSGARYLHLVRHPGGMIRSFEEAKLDQIFFRREHPFSRRELAELIWTASHRNILDFLAHVPRERHHRVIFEELVREPERVLRGVCEFLGLPYDPAMAAPYEERSSRRMTDGPHAASRALGDVKFLGHGGVRPQVAERWREQLDENELGRPTWEVASALGYPAPAGPSPWREIPARSEWPAGAEAPLSFAQERLWFLDRLMPGSSAYNMPVALRLSGGLDEAVLRASLEEIWRRHAVLRTTYREVDGRPLQRIGAADGFPLALADLSALPAERAAGEGERTVAAEASRPFDLAEGPLARGLAVRFVASEHGLLLRLHHIAADGWSLGVLVRELVATYAALARGRVSALPVLPLQYADYALWQRGWLVGERLEREIAYWRERLAGAPPIALPTDRPRRPARPVRGGWRGLALPARTVERLAEECRRAGATPFMGLLAAFAALLQRWTGQDDFSLGTPVAGRHRTEVEGVIGLFVNTLVLRVGLDRAPSWRELIARTRAVAVGAFAHQDLPFEKVVAELAPARDLATAPLFQVSFALQGAAEELPGGEEGAAALGLTLSSWAPWEAIGKFDLALTFSERGGPAGGPTGGMLGGLEYDRELFDPATLSRLAERLPRLLDALLARPETPIAELEVWAPSERHQIAFEWNDSAPRFIAEGRTIGARIAEQAGRAPDRVAVVGDGDHNVHLSYGELERRARSLALRLNRDFALGAEARVGLCVARTPTMVVGLLGIWFAGGAYVPLDPAYPAERLRYMLADSGAAAAGAVIVDPLGAS
ncbi:MAG TPA: amino acid adenylation domain-containing protein, partial [Thermoanaerobaculia bacterium]|nr:amino acid adenylation domain-containing protein [Thermoanaerobaculia bacterium]